MDDTQTWSTRMLLAAALAAVVLGVGAGAALGAIGNDEQGARGGMRGGLGNGEGFPGRQGGQVQQPRVGPGQGLPQGQAQRQVPTAPGTGT